MLVLNECLTLYVTANSDVERQEWVEHFSVLLNAVTVVHCFGLWQGISEPCVKIEHFCGDAKVAFRSIATELALYKHAASQAAIAVQFNSAPLVVFDTCNEITTY